MTACSSFVCVPTSLILVFNIFLCANIIYQHIFCNYILNFESSDELCVH